MAAQLLLRLARAAADGWRQKAEDYLATQADAFLGIRRLGLAWKFCRSASPVWS